MKKYEIDMANFTGNFGGTNFVNSIAEMDEVPMRLVKACMVTGQKVAPVKPKRKSRAKKKD